MLTFLKLFSFGILKIDTTHSAHFFPFNESDFCDFQNKQFHKKVKGRSKEQGKAFKNCQNDASNDTSIDASNGVKCDTN